MFILVTLHPKAAKLLDIVFEYIVKHCPFAHKVVVVCVRALKTVVKPVAPRNPNAPSAPVATACALRFIWFEII